MELKSTKMFQSAFEFNPSFIHYRVHSHRSGKPWKTTHGTRSETNGKTMENHGTPHGKPVENLWKTTGKPMKTTGKPMENLKKHGKPMENHGEKPGKPYGFSSPTRSCGRCPTNAVNKARSCPQSCGKRVSEVKPWTKTLLQVVSEAMFNQKMVVLPWNMWISIGTVFNFENQQMNFGMGF